MSHVGWIGACLLSPLSVELSCGALRGDGGQFVLWGGPGFGCSPSIHWGWAVVEAVALLSHVERTGA